MHPWESDVGFFQRARAEDRLCWHQDRLGSARTGWGVPSPARRTGAQWFGVLRAGRRRHRLVPVCHLSRLEWREGCGILRSLEPLAELAALGLCKAPSSPPQTPGMGQWVNNCSKKIIALAQRGPGWSPHPTNWTLLVASPVTGTRGSPAAPARYPWSHSLVAGGNFKSWGRN